MDSDLKSGYYYFGVKARVKDFRVVTKTEKCKKKKGTYSLQSISSQANGNAALFSNPLFYNWYKS